MCMPEFTSRILRIVKWSDYEVRLEVASNRDFTTFFLNPEMELVRNDSRFMSIGERAGLAKDWYESSQLPDFCDEPELTYDCREVIASEVGLPIARNDSIA
jgi:hypothetical protein